MRVELELICSIWDDKVLIMSVQMCTVCLCRRHLCTVWLQLMIFWEAWGIFGVLIFSWFPKYSLRTFWWECLYLSFKAIVFWILPMYSSRPWQSIFINVIWTIQFLHHSHGHLGINWHFLTSFFTSSFLKKLTISISFDPDLTFPFISILNVGLCVGSGHCEEFKLKQLY